MKVRRILRAAVIPVTAIALAAILFLCVFINAHISSQSMEPTVQAGAWVLGIRGGDISEGDVIFFYHRSETDIMLIKRVVACPGQSVEAHDDRVYVDGELFDDIPTNDFDPVTVPDGCFFVLGDNRPHSTDSRKWDEPFVRREDIVGRALFVYFPNFVNLQE